MKGAFFINFGQQLLLLETFVDPEKFRRIEHRRLAMPYLSGLISNSQAKSLEPIALEFLGQESIRSLQRVLKNCKWNDEAMFMTHQRLLSDQMNDPLIFFATIPLDYSANPNYQVCSAESMVTAKVARIQSNFAFNRS